MKWGHVIFLGALGAFAASEANAALQVETMPFIASAIAQMDFETLNLPSFAANTPYEEGGISISYVWSAPFGDIASSGVDLGGGSHGWYAIDYAGFTTIKLAGGGSFDQIQFNAATGGPSSDGSNLLQYQLLVGGVAVATGATGPLAVLGTGASIYGFSGISFDEVRLRADRNLAYYDGTHQGDALGLDNIVIGKTAIASVPEPSTWTMMLSGTLLLGWVMRRPARAMVA